MSKVIAISMVKNEVDVIESFVRYNLKFVDELHIVNHYSTDNTGIILDNLKQEGLPLVLYNSPIFEHRQARIMTDLLHLCLHNDHDIEYVIPLDADEFIDSPNKAHFLSCLSSIPDNHVGIFFWKTYLPNSLIVDPYFLSNFNEVRYDKLIMGKVIIPRKLGLTGAISAGNHIFYKSFTEKFSVQNRYPSAIFIPNKLRRFKDPVHNTENIFIDEEDLQLAHYPVRSKNQVLTKSMVGAITMGMQNLLHSDQDLYWNVLAEQYFNKKNYGIDTLRKEAFLYRSETAYPTNWDNISLKFETENSALIEQPLELKYTHLINVSPLENVFKASMGLLRYYAEQNKQLDKT